MNWKKERSEKVKSPSSDERMLPASGGRVWSIAMGVAVALMLTLAQFSPVAAEEVAAGNSAAGNSAAQENTVPDAAQLMKEAHLVMFYAADDGVAEVQMKIVNSRGKERLREFAMMRLDLEEGGKQDYYTYFRKPHDVSRMSFMVHKLPKETDNRWIYVPSVDLIKRISSDDKASSFVGSDFTYEDISGRHWTEDTHKLLKEDTYNSRKVYVVESIPLEKYKGFARKVTFIDAENKLIMKEEYYNAKGDLARIFTAERVEEHDGVLTSVFRKMENVKKKQYTTVEFSSIRYNVGMKESIFTERFLKNPPREFIK
ncbi:MAG: outer membrane lipoprotein-sorting protein [Candidatus Krumholzibacteria bacterium]|nr:outer membrane lipoprotein-sorting protein [Candidatus Krumholzibacteria bacterium]